MSAKGTIAACITLSVIACATQIPLEQRSDEQLRSEYLALLAREPECLKRQCKMGPGAKLYCGNYSNVSGTDHMFSDDCKREIDHWLDRIAPVYAALHRRAIDSAPACLQNAPIPAGSIRTLGYNPDSPNVNSELVLDKDLVVPQVLWDRSCADQVCEWRTFFEPTKKKSTYCAVAQVPQ